MFVFFRLTLCHLPFVITLFFLVFVGFGPRVLKSRLIVFGWLGVCVMLYFLNTSGLQPTCSILDYFISYILVLLRIQG